MTTPLRYKPATFVRRLMAMFYDTLLVAALLLIASALSLLLNFGKTAGESSVLVQILVTVWLLGITFAYYGISWTISGQTLGLRTWRMRVLHENGGAINRYQALVRFIVGLIAVISVIGILWMLFNKDKRAWHDLASYSLVDERN